MGDKPAPMGMGAGNAGGIDACFDRAAGHREMQARGGKGAGYGQQGCG